MTAVNTAATGPILVWFRRDLRLRDNPALLAATAQGAPVIPVFIWAPDEEHPWAPGAASRWWLHHSLERLTQSLSARGLRLILRHGPSLPALRDLVRETGAAAVYWNRLYEPAVLARDRGIKAELRREGLDARSFNAGLLHEPWTVLTRKDKPYQVFTPFLRACRELGEPTRPAPAPAAWPAYPRALTSLELSAFRLTPSIPWDAGLAAAWQPGEKGAQALLADFVRTAASRDDSGRDRPDHPGTSRLSPHLHFGEISPQDVWWAVRAMAPATGPESYLRQLIWREFAHHLLFHFPHTTLQPLREEFARFPWVEDALALCRWQEGRTGFPLVDAGMRQLWRTGWMHNRVRMVVASFLVKDLLVPWQQGAAWFWDTLVDADLANNTLGWQWSAGCGADAAPYFRILNPVLQSRKFDPAGDYLRAWIPELRGLPADAIHAPLGTDTDPPRTAGVEPGHAYPKPLVDHAVARGRALEAYAAMRRRGPRPSGRKEKD